MQKNKILGYTAAIMATFFWGMQPIIIRYLIDQDIHPNNIGFLRASIAGIILIALSFWNKKDHQKRFSYNAMFWIGAIGLAGSFLLFHQGIELAAESNALVIETFSPVLVFLIGLFVTRKRFIKIAHRHMLSKLFFIISLGSIGSSLLILQIQNPIIYEGISLSNISITISTICFAFFLISSDELKKSSRKSSIFLMGRILLASSILMLPFINFQNLTLLNANNWTWVVVIALSGTAVAFTLWNLASKYLSVSPLSMMFNLTAIFTIISEYIFLSTNLKLNVIIATIIIIIAATQAEKINSQSD